MEITMKTRLYADNKHVETSTTFSTIQQIFINF